MGQSIQLQGTVIGAIAGAGPLVSRHLLAAMYPGLLFYWEQDVHACFTLVQFPEDSPPHDASRFMGATFWDLGDNLRDAESNWLRYCSLFATRAPIIDYVVQRASGDQRWFSITAQPMFDYQGCCTGYCGVMCEVGRLRRA